MVINNLPKLASLGHEILKFLWNAQVMYPHIAQDICLIT
jgi:hypothetical protein